MINWSEWSGTDLFDVIYQFLKERMYDNEEWIRKDGERRGHDQFYGSSTGLEYENNNTEIPKEIA
jgi:hypothetical protein